MTCQSKTQRSPVYSNVDAAPHQSAEEIRNLLSQQVVSPVRWEDSIHSMLDGGVEAFLEAGTGRVLARNAKANQPQAANRRLR